MARGSPLSFLAFIAFLSSCLAAASPNVVILFIDDLGYGDLGFQGYGAETPHIDALARRGMVMKNWHAMSVCTPSR